MPQPFILMQLIQNKLATPFDESIIYLSFIVNTHTESSVPA